MVNAQIYIINGKDNEKTAYASMLVDSYLRLYEEYLQNEYLINTNINPNEVLNIIDYEVRYIDEENIKAKYEDGILVVTLNKKLPEKVDKKIIID